jgi:hypothetical protein
MQILLRLGILGMVGLSVLPEGSVLPSTKGEVKAPLSKPSQPDFYHVEEHGRTVCFRDFFIVNLIAEQNLSSMAI